MAEPINYYAILGIPRSSSREEIRRAYLDAARRLHPDKNVTPGDTEFFLNIQQAYEVLSNPKKREKYDATLPPEESITTPIIQKTTYSRRNLLKINEPQLVYTLVEFTPPDNTKKSTYPPLNLSLVLDSSTSMKGVKLDIVKNTAIQLLRRLRPEDMLSVIAFNDRAELVIPSMREADVNKLEARIRILRTSGGTEIFRGLEIAFNEVQRSLNPANVNHIVLLTDGRTYGDEAQCLELADRAAELGIGISGLGIGHDWNDVFLDELAKRTGGSSQYISRPQDIRRILMGKFNNLAQVFAEDARLDFSSSPGVELHYAFRLQPEAGLLPLESPLRLGPILRETSLKIFLEFMVQPEALNELVVLLNGSMHFSIAAAPAPPIPVRLACPTSEETPEAPPQEIVQALSSLTLYRIQEQAQLEVKAGQYNRASEHLQRLATHLLAQGERGLAHTVLLEADHLQRKGEYSPQGKKDIKYGTRALLVTGGD